MQATRRLNYQHLFYFWTVVRAGGLARAAAELNLSVAAISSQLRTFEQRLGEQLLAKAGRRLVPTDTGRTVLRYAEDIFRLGRELQEALALGSDARPLRLAAGIDDVVPKELAQQLIAPALALGRRVQLTCHEGTLERLTAALAVHDLDVVLSDAPVPARLGIRAHSHRLGGSGVSWMGSRSLVKGLRARFPDSLAGAPVLLPTDDTAIRRSLDEWFARLKLAPLVVGEFEDYAMLREFARAGRGLIPVPDVIGRPMREASGLAVLGPARPVEAEYFAVTLHRESSHPAVAAICARAGALFASPHTPPRTS
ncbi:MAG: LysR substrate-binding domain-containing protein [Steroidobacteraceae bacterium]